MNFNNLKALKTTIAGAALIGASIYLMVHNQYYEYLTHTFLIGIGVLLLVAPNNVVDLILSFFNQTRKKDDESE